MLAPARMVRILAGQDVGARAAARRERGTLRDNRVSQGTLNRYKHAVAVFEDFRVLVGLPFADDTETLDGQLCNFIEHLWEEGESRGIASDLVCASQHFLMRRRCFAGAWSLLSTWQRMELPDRAAPLPQSVAIAMAGLAWRHKHFDMSALLLLGFDAFLRTGELFSIKRCHVSVGTSSQGLVALPLTKSGRRQGAQEMVTVSDKLTNRVLAAVCRGLAPDALVLQRSPASFRTLFSRYLQELGLSRFQFRPYSLRRGGATAFFLREQDVPRTLLRGRWCDLRTARIYITEGAALLAQLQLSAAEDRALQEAAAVLGVFG
jgi:hypothetical protein